MFNKPVLVVPKAGSTLHWGTLKHPFILVRQALAEELERDLRAAGFACSQKEVGWVAGDQEDAARIINLTIERSRIEKLREWLRDRETSTGSRETT
jgi:hypothetical protein